jgi:3-oxoacyl-[acyl-carrier protein] reductase
LKLLDKGRSSSIRSNAYRLNVDLKQLANKPENTTWSQYTGFMEKPLALITGAGRSASIGAGIARQLASDGWDIAINYWPSYDLKMSRGPLSPDLDNLITELTAAGAKVIAIPGDLAHADTAKTIFDIIAKSERAASGLVLSHCQSVNSGILDTSLQSFEQHFAVNARASWQLIREFALQVPSEGGRIVALTSDSVVNNLPYGASKAALDRIVLAAARELAHLHIVSNVINPGPVDTGWMSEADRMACLSHQPSGRLGTPTDAAHLVSFLFSDRGTWINGQLLKSDGGFSA